MVLRNLDHQVWKRIKENRLEDKKILVGLSGGLDSVVLLNSLNRVHQGKVIAAHFHHGKDENHESNVYRDQALNFCRELCSKNGITLITEESSDFLSSESEMRDHRRAFFDRVSFKFKVSILSLAHHKDDLLETRFIRLIRGTGPQGLSGMQTINEWKTDRGLIQIFRPLLRFTRKELTQYALDERLSYLEDPSNENSNYLRNWLRREWLPLLEKRHPGALDRISVSFQNLADFIKDQEGGKIPSNVDLKEGISRSYFMSLSRADQLRLLAKGFLSLNRRDFSQGQMEEIIKRLDNPQNELRFQVAGLVWIVNALQIKVQS